MINTKSSFPDFIDSEFIENHTSVEQSEEEIAALLEKLPFTKNKGFKWRYKTQGYSNYAFGARIVNNHNVINLMHEIAHAVEFGPSQYGKRARFGTFKFNTNTFWFHDRYVTEQTTFQASFREARAEGIQCRLLEMLGFTVDVSALEEYGFSLTEYMPDSYYGKTHREEYKSAFFDSYHTHTPSIINLRMKHWLRLSASSERKLQKRISAKQKIAA